MPPNGQDASYAGGYGIVIGTGAKNPDGAWSLLDFLFQPDVQLKWNLAQIRIPSSISVAKQLVGSQNDPLLTLAVQSMPGGRFVPSVPGSELILPIYGDAILSVLQKKAQAQTALTDAQQRCQMESDKYLMWAQPGVGRRWRPGRPFQYAPVARSSPSPCRGDRFVIRLPEDARDRYGRAGSLLTVFLGTPQCPLSTFPYAGDRPVAIGLVGGALR